MAGKQFKVRQRSPQWSERPYSRRRGRLPSQRRAPRPAVEAAAVVISLLLAVGGALFFGAWWASKGLPFFVGYGAVLLLLGAAGVVSARRTWSRVATGVGVLIALVIGMVLLHPAGRRAGDRAVPTSASQARVGTPSTGTR